jgi:hypothetical protein
MTPKENDLNGAFLFVLIMLFVSTVARLSVYDEEVRIPHEDDIQLNHVWLLGFNFQAGF